MYNLKIEIKSNDREFIREILANISHLSNDNCKVTTKITENNNSDIKSKVIELLRKGYPAEEIVKRTGLTKQQVAAYRAHLTMGHY